MGEVPLYPEYSRANGPRHWSHLLTPCPLAARPQTASSHLDQLPVGFLKTSRFIDLTKWTAPSESSSVSFVEASHVSEFLLYSIFSPGPERCPPGKGSYRGASLEMTPGGERTPETETHRCTRPLKSERYSLSSVLVVQGYLAHKKTPPPRTLQ